MASVRVAAWRDAYQDIVPRELLDSLSAEQDIPRFTKWIARSDIDSFVVEDRGVVLGFCLLWPSRDDDATPETGVIALLYLRAAARRRGLGRRLLERALDEARVRGYREITLWVLDQNQPARRFYETMGFTPDGVEKLEPVAGNALLREVRYRTVL